MTRLGWIVVLSFLLIVALGVGGFFTWRDMQKAPVAGLVQNTSTTTPTIDPTTLSIYTSGEYGFSLFYPALAKLTDSFSTSTSQALPWRTQSSSSGIPILRITHANEEVRLGMSTALNDISSCTKTGPAEIKTAPLVTGSTTWEAFTFQKLGTENEQNITSYRTIRAKSCYALELFQPVGAVASTTGYTLGETITSFTFAN